MTHSRPTIHKLLEEHRLAARRELGQNFVADPNTVRKIAALAHLGPDDVVVEIGPGLGSLTLALIETGAKVIAVEVDAGLARVTAEVVGDRAAVIVADALELDWEELLAEVSSDTPVHLVANLPYNVGTTIVIDVLANVKRVTSMLVLVQAEVADRMVAGVGSSAYGIPSILIALHASAEIVGHVPPSVFVPRPKVDSSLVRLTRLDRSASTVSHEQLARVVKAGFGQRRKMLRRSMKDVATENQLVAAGINPTQRAEEVDLEHWSALAELLASDSAVQRGDGLDDGVD